MNKFKKLNTNSSPHETSEKLKRVLFDVPPGIPLTAKYLSGAGISRQLIYAYTKNGWLETLGQGYYKRKNDIVTRDGVVRAMEMQGLSIHIGGKTSLSQYGFLHFISSDNSKVYLYGSIYSIPEWINKMFICVVNKKKLFNESLYSGERLYVNRIEQENEFSPYYSDPERAILEMLSDVPENQSMDESEKIMETMQGLRAEVLQTLLEHCISIKVKRIFASEAMRLELPVIKQIELNKIDFGSRSKYIISKNNSSLILENPVDGLYGQ